MSRCVLNDDQLEIYGADPVYCAACDQAISLEERALLGWYRPGRGLVHGRCPRPGSAPRLPEKERTARVAQYARAKARHRLAS